jgi:hypothetical protein
VLITSPTAKRGNDYRPSSTVVLINKLPAKKNT